MGHGWVMTRRPLEFESDRMTNASYARRDVGGNCVGYGDRGSRGNRGSRDGDTARCKAGIPSSPAESHEAACVWQAAETLDPASYAPRPVQLPCGFQKSPHAQTVVQHGRSGVRDAKKNERSRLRSGASPRAPTVLEGIVHSYPPTPSLPRQALVSWPHGDRLSDASTPLAAFSRILLDGPHSLRGISEA